MREVRERSKEDKVRGRGNRRFRTGIHRQLTAKLRRELMKGQRNDGRNAGVQAVDGIAHGVKRLTSVTVGALAGAVGGSVVLVALCMVLLIAGVMASPFGILFANEPVSGAVSLSEAVEEINREYTETLETLQEGDYDSIVVQGTPPDWREVVAVFAVHMTTNGGMDVAILDAEYVKKLRTVFWDMCTITSEVEIIFHPDTNSRDGMDTSWIERKLKITIETKSADEMRMEYDFDAVQNDALSELLSETELLDELLGCD